MKRGRPKKCDAIDWASQPFDAESNAEMAKRLGCTAQAVGRQRRLREDPSPRCPDRIDWENLPLGRMSDNAIAKKIGRDPHTVSTARRRRGIPSFTGWRAKNIDWDVQPLGEVTDASIAEAIGCSREAVRQARTRRGIGPADDQTWRRSEVGPSLPDWDDIDLGKRQDEEIAADIGCSADAVKAARLYRGIRALRFTATELKDAAILAALEKPGSTKRGVARELGIHWINVYRAIKRSERRRATNGEGT